MIINEYGEPVTISNQIQGFLCQVMDAGLPLLTYLWIIRNEKMKWSYIIEVVVFVLTFALKAVQPFVRGARKIKSVRKNKRCKKSHV